MASVISAKAEVIVSGSISGNIIPDPLHTGVFTTNGLPGDEQDLKVKNATRSIAQTVQIYTLFALDAVVIEFQAPAAGYLDGTVTMRIFPVEDVQAETLISSGADLLNVSVLLNSATRAAAGFTTSTTTTSQLKFDLTGVHEVIVPANNLLSSPTAGYAIEFSTADNGSNNGGLFTWERNSAAPYLNGRGYIVGAAQSTDYSVMLVSLPEPNVLAFLAWSIACLGAWRRTRRRI